MFKRRKSVKVIALVGVAAMLVGLVTGLIFALGSGSNTVTGTYKLPDGSSLVLDSQGTATITVPGQEQPASTSYRVEDDKVLLVDPSTGKAIVTFKADGKTLVDTSGQTKDIWVKK
jgi:hypothetical protein